MYRWNLIVKALRHSCTEWHNLTKKHGIRRPGSVVLNALLKMCLQRALSSGTASHLRWNWLAHIIDACNIKVQKEKPGPPDVALIASWLNRVKQQEHAKSVPHDLVYYALLYYPSDFLHGYLESVLIAVTAFQEILLYFGQTLFKRFGGVTNRAFWYPPWCKISWSRSWWLLQLLGK